MDLKSEKSFFNRLKGRMLRPFAFALVGVRHHDREYLLACQEILHDSQSLSEALEMNDFAFPQEL